MENFYINEYFDWRVRRTSHLDRILYDSFEGLPSTAAVDDYCDEAVHPDGWNHLRGVKQACDEFLYGKPERVSNIYSGCFSHGFFRKL